MGKKLFVSVFLFIFLAAGAVLTVLTGASVFRSAKMLDWKSFDCVIERSSITDKSPYKLDIQYAYDLAGRRYTGTVFSTEYSGSDDYYDTQKLLNQYAAGTKTTCLVNPADNSQAVLERLNPWTGLVILFPMLFAFVGALGLYLIWRPGAGEAARRFATRHGTVLASLFFGVFFAAGMSMLLVGFLPDILRSNAAKHWPQVPCIVDHSRVGSESGGGRGGTTYSVEILFEYRFDGHSYKSSRYQLSPVYTDDYDFHQQIVNSLPPGTRTVCYVNPLDPADAVMDRSAEGLILTGGLSILFMLVGGAGELGVIFAARKHRAQKRAPLVEHLSANGFVSLKPAYSALAKSFTVWVLALGWCGLTSMIATLVVLDWMKGSHQWPALIFVLVFSTIGLHLLGYACFNSLSWQNPVPHISISNLPIRLGHETEIRWRFDDKADWLRNLRLEVRGCQIQPTTIVTDYRWDVRFWQTELTNTSNPSEIRAGLVRFTIPPDVWPTTIADGAMLVCVLLVDGAILHWPRLQFEFLLPLDATGAAATYPTLVSHTIPR